MLQHTERYAVLIFDCDGVILNSNKLKTQAFSAVTLPFGLPASSALVNYHAENGGISRYAKFEYFVDIILPKHAPNLEVSDRWSLLQKLLTEFAAHIAEGLRECDIAQGLQRLRHATPNARWMVVSGGQQDELREVLRQRELTQYFDGGIYGSPEDKRSIVSRLLKEGIIERPALYLGDSRLDHKVATENKLEFVFVANWTEFDEWPRYTRENKITTISQINDLNL